MCILDGKDAYFLHIAMCILDSKDAKFLHKYKEYTDQATRINRPNWVFVGRTYQELRYVFFFFFFFFFFLFFFLAAAQLMFQIQYNFNGSNRTRMARLPWMIWTLFFSPYKILPIAQENKYLGIFFFFFFFFFLFYYGIVCCVYTWESPHRGDANEYTQHTIVV